MPAFGSELVSSTHFHDHMKQQIPVQIYRQGIHEAIGFIAGYNRYFVEVGGTLYNRKVYVFVSRPGY